MALALAVWSVMTALCGIASQFWHLLLLRAGVGVGEAGANPPLTSMISDFYAPEQRARAIATAAVGVNLAASRSEVGSGISTAGGWLGIGKRSCVLG